MTLHHFQKLMVNFADTSGHAGEKNKSCCLGDVTNFVSQASLLAPNLTALPQTELKTVLRASEVRVTMFYNKTNTLKILFFREKFLLGVTSCRLVEVYLRGREPLWTLM
jgi:hypothetical protein